MRAVLEISAVELTAMIDFFKYGAENWQSIGDLEPGAPEVKELFKFIDKEKYLDVVAFLGKVLKARMEMMSDEEKRQMDGLSQRELTRTLITQSVELLQEMQHMITSQIEKAYEKNPNLRPKFTN